MPLPVDTSQRARRLEIWSDVECAGGVLRAVIPDGDRLNPRTEDGLDGTRQLTVEIPRDSAAWSEVEEQRILRVDYSDTEAREFRIRDVDERVDPDGSRIGSLTAEGIRYDLITRSEILERVEANGLARPHFEIYQRSPADHVDLILGGPSPYSSGAPSYVTAGTIEPTADVDMIYDWDTPLSALQELTKVIEGTAELQVRRNGATDYRIDILRQVGGSAPTVYFRVGRNVSAFRRRRTAKSQGTRVYPRGGGRGGEQATMAGARWPIASIAGSTLTMEDDLLNEDGQLVGRYLEAEDGSLVEVTGSTAPDQLTVADVSPFTAGEVVRARRNAAGDELTYLESPSAVSTYGVIPKTHDRQDVPPVDNLAANPYLTAWSGGTPDSWNVIGSPPVTENTNDQFTEKGGSSARVGDGSTKAAAGEGLETAAIDIQPTDEHPYFSAQAALWVVSGSVRVEMIDVTNGVTWPKPESEQRAVTDELGTWVKRLGVSGVDDMNAAGTQQVKFRIVADEDGTEFYLDAAMVTQTPAGRDTFYHDLGSNRLWQAALDELALHADPISTYELNVRDLTSLDETRWPDEEVCLGADVRARSSELGIDVTRRVQRIRRDPFRPAKLEVEVESEEERLSRKLARSNRRRRDEEEERPGETTRPADPTGVLGFYDSRVVLVWNDAEGAARYLIRTQGSGATAVERWENGTAWASVADTQYVEVDPGSGSLDLSIRAVSETGRPSSGVAELSVSATGQLVREETEETADQGTVRVTPVWGDGSRTFQVEWWWRDANTSFPGSPDQTDTGIAHGGTRSFQNALPEEHGGSARYRVTDEATGIEIADRVVTFDKNKRPNHQGHTLSREGDEIYLEHNGDADWASLKYAKAVGAPGVTAPTKADVQAGVTVGGRTGRTLIHSGLAKGDQIKIGVLGYSQASASGLESTEVWRDSETRPGAQDAADASPTVEIRPDPDSGTQTQYVTQSYDVVASAGDDVSSPSLEVRTAIVYGDTNLGWSGWSASPKDIDVPTLGKAPQTLLAQARDTSLSGNPTSDVASLAVEPRLEGLDGSDDGRVHPGVKPGGGYSPPGGATLPEIRYIFDQSFNEGQNLLGNDAQGPFSGTGTFPGSPVRVLLSKIDSEGGDVLSAGVKVKSATGTDRVRVEIRYRDDTDTIIRTDNGSEVTSSTYTRSVIENSEIPADTHSIQVQTRNIDATEQASAKWYILNDGPTARRFNQPPIRTHRETAADLYRTTSRTAAIQAIVQRLQDSGHAKTGMLHGDFSFDRHTEIGTAQNTDTGIAFGQNYGGVPNLTFVPQIGRVYSSANSNTDQKADIRDENTTVSSFDMRAELVTSSSVTPISDGFSGSQNAGAPENGDASLSSTTGAVFSNLEDANSTPVEYTITYGVDTTGLSSGSSITLHFWHNDGASSTNWTEFATRSYGPGFNLSDEQVKKTLALGSNYDIRITVTEDLDDITDSWTVTAHGEDNSTPGVQFDRDDGSNTVSMTPGSSDKIAYFAKDSS